MTDTVTDSTGTRYESGSHGLTLIDQDGDRTLISTYSVEGEGRLLVGGRDRAYVEPAEYIRQVAKLAGLEVTIGGATPDQSEPEAEEPGGAFPVAPNLSAIEVTEGLVARGSLPHGVLPHYDDRTGRLLGVQMYRGDDSRLEVVSLGDYLVGGGGEPIRAVDRHLFDAFYRRVGA